MTKHQMNAKASGACIESGQDEEREAVFMVLGGAK